MIEFKCVDCGGNVINIIGLVIPTPPRCLTCEWIAAEIDPTDYPAIKKALNMPVKD